MNENRLHILMIEDVARYHKTFGTEISHALNAQVDFVTSGEEGLQKLADQPNHYDIVLLDLNLPGMNGQQVVQYIRSERAYDNIIIIILTGSSSTESESMLLGLGANEFIEKGCAPELFIARLKAQCRTKLALDKATQIALDRDLFAAGVLHDLRNIETNLLATCELIEMQVKADPIKDRAALLQDVANLKIQVRRMEDYASTIIGQVREGHSAPKIRETHIPEACFWASNFLQAGKNDSQLHIVFLAETKPVLADPSSLRLVFVNLFQNAIKYARRGVPPQIEISQIDNDTTIVTKVTDNGIGIPEEDLRHIFQPFYRGTQTKGAQKGFGLGLSMVAKVIGKMNGRVWAERVPGQDFGTTFCVELPK